MIQLAINASSFLAAVSSALAAFFWYRASQVEAPKDLVGSAPMGGPVVVNTRPLVEFAKESGRRNKVAALWSAAAAFFAFLAWGLGMFAHARGLSGKPLPSSSFLFDGHINQRRNVSQGVRV